MNNLDAKRMALTRVVTTGLGARVHVQFRPVCGSLAYSPRYACVYPVRKRRLHFVPLRSLL